MRTDGTTGDALTREHRLLERLMQRHQRALIDARFDRAIDHWRHYRLRLASHIAPEEAWLDRVDASSLRWRIKVYRAEHRRILLLADKITARLSHPARRESADYRITLLECEKTLKGVLEHHHKREEEDLYISLDGGRHGPLPRERQCSRKGITLPPGK